MSYETWLAFVITLYTVSIIPGPSMLLALSHGVKYGARATIATCAGNATASAIQATITIAGLGAIIAASASFFLLIKYLGALYLIYLGLMFWRSPALNTADGSSQQSAKGGTKMATSELINMYKQGFIVAIGNPKAIVFFTALFPQFINLQASNILQQVMIISVTCSCAFICAMAYALGGNQLAKVFQKSSFSKVFNKLTGGCFVGGGIAIMFTGRY